MLSEEEAIVNVPKTIPPDYYYNLAKKNNLIFTEAHLIKGGSDNGMILHTTITRSLSTSNQPYFRDTGVPQWSREKHRYLTYDEWLAEQHRAEEHQPVPYIKGKHHGGFSHQWKG